MGTTYAYQVKARNIYGYGAASETTSILAASAPDVPNSVSSAFGTVLADYVTITWSLSSNGGSPITSYTI
jgi:hypothetical protein